MKEDSGLQFVNTVKTYTIQRRGVIHKSKSLQVGEIELSNLMCTPYCAIVLDKNEKVLGIESSIQYGTFTNDAISELIAKIESMTSEKSKTRHRYDRWERLILIQGVVVGEVKGNYKTEHW